MLRIELIIIRIKTDCERLDYSININEIKSLLQVRGLQINVLFYLKQFNFSQVFALK